MKQEVNLSALEIFHIQKDYLAYELAKIQMLQPISEPWTTVARLQQL